MTAVLPLDQVPFGNYGNRTHASGLSLRKLNCCRYSIIQNGFCQPRQLTFVWFVLFAVTILILLVVRAALEAAHSSV